jgi:hypothetical protein
LRAGIAKDQERRIQGAFEAEALDGAESRLAVEDDEDGGLRLEENLRRIILEARRGRVPAAGGARCREDVVER